MHDDEIHPNELKLPGFVVPIEVCRRRDLSPSAKLCFGWLLPFFGAHTENWPSLSELARGIGASEKDTERDLKILRRKNLIPLLQLVGERRHAGR